MKNHLLLWVGALLITLLSGCATTSYQAINVDGFESAKPSLSELDNWQINAKLGVRTATDAQSIRMLWQQQGEEYQLRLNGPLGFGTAYIVGDSEQAEIQKGGQLITASPQQLVMQLTGVPLPITALSWWVKGLVSPNHSAATDIQRAQTGQLENFQQAGWQISILSYSQTGTYWTPKKIAGRQGELSFKLVISDWQFSNNRAAE
ncbi:lipoprotein insertase outer membrane protein LolB [Porticoccaceae bacterium]|nr:lipoprotein insertase outer membrane protein LolB [Porticoccaceae bacterium]